MTASTDPWGLLVLATGMVLILEGLLPFLSPSKWRAVFEQATRLTDGQLRFLGLASLVIGCMLLVLALS